MIEVIYPQILVIHVASALMLIGLVVYSDVYGMSWIHGARETLDTHRIDSLHTYVWYGIGTMIVTGALLFYPYQSFFLHSPAFLIKMVFVATIILNGYAIGTLKSVASEKPFRETVWVERIPLLVSGTISTVSWTGVVIASFYIGL